MAFTQASLDAEIAQKLAPNGQNSITATILSSVMDDVVAAIFQGVGFAPVVVQPSSAPSSVGNWTSFAGAFGGDNSKIVTGVKYNLISGTPIPTSGATPYAFTPELTPDVSFMVVGSGAGANFDTADDGGRTGVANRATYNTMLGQGDSFGHFFNMVVGSSRPGATSFLANPCIIAVGGGLFGGANGAFITPVSWVVQDQGFDVAFIGDITTGTRTNDTGALGALWVGYYPQAVSAGGAKAWDAFYFGQGKTKMGIDLTAIITNPSGTWTNAAIVLKSLDRMYFNGTPGGTPVFCSNPGQDFIEHNGSGICIISGNNPSLQVYSTEVILTVPLSITPLASQPISAPFQGGTGSAYFNLNVTGEANNLAANGLNAHNINFGYGGATLRGTRNGLNIYSHLDNGNASNLTPFYGAINAVWECWDNDTSSSSGIAITGFALMQAGTGWHSVEGAEISAGIATGASAAFRIALNVAGNGNVQGSSGDYAIAVSASSGGQFNEALAFNTFNGVAPVKTTGTLIGTSGAGYTVNYGIDFSALTMLAPIVAPLITPASSGATGKSGSIVWDAGFIYICTATNTWKRAALSTF